MNTNKKLIPISALVVFGTITLAELETKQQLPTTDQWLGFAVAFFILSALSDLGLPLAGGLAVLAMVSVLLSRGEEALRFADKAGKRKPTKNRAEKTGVPFEAQLPNSARSIV